MLAKTNETYSITANSKRSISQALYLQIMNGKTNEQGVRWASSPERTVLRRAQ